MTRTTPGIDWRRAGIGLTLCCLLSATALSATAAEGEDPAAIPVPERAPAAVAEEIAAKSETPAELLATPRIGSPSSYLLDAPEPSDADTSIGARSLSAAAAGGSFSGTITGLVGGAVQPLPGAIVYALKWDDATQDYDNVAGVMADSAGKYTIGGLPAGDYLMMAADNDSTLQLLPEFWQDAPVAQWADIVTVADGADTAGIDETLEPLFKAYIAGADRYETSAAISASFDEGVPCVYIASGENFPDALSAGPAASKCGGPLLLVRPWEAPQVILEELERLQPAEIIIAGGPNAIAPAVESALQAYGPVRRIAGSDRYDTSRQIVADAFDSAGALWLATGTNFPDALAASGAASAAYLPVLIVPGNAPSLDTASMNSISALSPNIVAVAGGTAVVSDGILDHVWNSGIDVVRFGGVDRYDTSLQINEAVWDVEAGAWSVFAFMTNGQKFPDALSGAPLAGGLLGAPLYIVPPHCTPIGVRAHMLEGLGVHAVYLLGYFSQLDFGKNQFQIC